MGVQLDWQIGEEDDGLPEFKRRRWPLSSLTMAIIMGLVGVALWGGWQASREQLARADAELLERVQTTLDWEHSAFVTQDGELFLSVQMTEPAWISARLRPENQATLAAGLTATRVDTQGEEVWANVSWSDEDGVWQRIAFFHDIGGKLYRAPAGTAYWGDRLQRNYGWGTLHYYEVDEPFIEAVDEFVSRVNLPGRVDLTLANDYGDTALADHLRLPSPRLLALDENGQPAPQFWQTLEQKLLAYQTPVTIRFAVPPIDLGDVSGVATLPFQTYAAAFMAQNPHITVEIIELEDLPQDLNTLATQYDGASFAPTEAMIAGGQVADLTDFVATDPTFDEGDFYEQIWQGTLWRNRVWFMPQAATMRVFYYDLEAYRQAELPPPSPRWTWSEMADDVSTLVANQPEMGDLYWGFLDTGLDALLSYAYNWNNPCQQGGSTTCQSQLYRENVGASLEWYGGMAGQPGRMPDLTQFSTQDRELALWRNQSSRRRAAIWIDLPKNYEHQLLLSHIGVVPFPGSDRFDGITPLTVQGSFISQHSQHPQAMWEWLKFLSYQPPIHRLVPARPSVATDMRYWSTLPRPLGDAMRTAFPFARPVTLSERTFLSWERVADVVSGEQTALEAARYRPFTPWFTP